MILRTFVGLDKYISSCEYAMRQARTMVRRSEIEACMSWARCHRAELIALVMAECGALARIAMKGKRQAMLSEEIAFWHWCDERFGNPGALTLRHYHFIRGFVHG